MICVPKTPAEAQQREALFRAILHAEYMKSVQDPEAVAKLIGFEPDDWQLKLLRSTSDRIILNCSRQVGKSTTAALLVLHQALAHPGSLIILVSPSLRQSSELFRKFADATNALPDKPEMEVENRLSFEFANGSRVVAIPASERTTVGFSAVDLIVEDESAYVPDNIYRALRPMLAVSKGRYIQMSTPMGKRGHFYQAWSGSKNWERYMVLAEPNQKPPATDGRPLVFQSGCDRISPEYLAEELEELGPLWFRQFYRAEFVELVDQIFTEAMIASAFAGGREKKVTALFGAKVGAIDPIITLAPKVKSSALFGGLVR